MATSSNVNGKSNKPRSSVQGKVERKVVGQYIIGKTIGEGTFGKVKLAIHIPTSEKVAIKVLEKKRIKQQADVRRVNREIKILKKSKHVNIIQLYEVLDTQNSIYLIMENAEGGEMFDYIVSQRHVPELQACNFFRQIVNGVEELHRNNITHRDLKPENLLLKKSYNGWLVKIVDFGLSNTHEGGKLLSTACGSPCYAAPEMIAGKKYNGPLVDIWSLGVILFALVCGYLPFEDPNTSQLYRKILSGDYTTPKWISNEVGNLISKILEIDCTKRYKISDIRKHCWYGIDKDSPFAETPPDIPLTNNPIIEKMAQNGNDPKLVIDGLVSSACNSLTATYYLLLQKHNRETMNKPIETSKVNQNLELGSVAALEINTGGAEANTAEANVKAVANTVEAVANTVEAAASTAEAVLTEREGAQVDQSEISQHGAPDVTGAIFPASSEAAVETTSINGTTLSARAPLESRPSRLLSSTRDVLHSKVPSTIKSTKSPSTVKTS